MAAKGKRRFPVLAALALGLFAALLLVPQTGWVVREQLRMQVPPPSPLAGVLTLAHDPHPAWKPALLAAAARHPDDLDLQVVAAREPGEGDEAVAQRLRELRERFPPTPLLSAAILSHAAHEEARLPSTWTPPGREPPPPPTPEALAAYDRAAAEAERLDPDNGFFPAMRARGHFAAGRDEEGLAALRRAAEKPTWNDYQAELSALAGRATMRVWGRPSALERQYTLAVAGLPALPALRGLARHTTQRAAELERAGLVEEGLALRQATARLGARLRTEGSFGIGALFGAAIVDESAANPGGTEAADSQRLIRSGAQRETYAAYLRAAGGAAEADWFEAETAAGDRTRAVVSAGRARVDDSHGLVVRSGSLQLAWGAGAALLANLLGLLLLALVAALALRFRRVPGWVVVLFLLGALGGQTALSMGAGAVWAWSFFLIGDDLRGLLPVEGSPWLYGSEGFLANLEGLGIALPLALPALVLAGVWLMSVFRADGGFYRRLRRAAPAVACLLVFGYAAVVSFTLREEAAVHAQLDRVLEHQGRYLADLAGLEWPE